MSVMAIITLLSPLVIGFGMGYLANRRQGDTPMQATLDTLVELLEKYLARDLDGDGVVGHNAAAPAVPSDPVTPVTPATGPLFDIIHKLLDREKK